MPCAPPDGVISPQFAPVTPALQAHVQSQGRDSRPASASTGTTNASPNCNSFSQVLKSYSNGGGTSDRASTKTAKPDGDTENKAQDDVAASEAAVPVPVQQPLTLLSGLLGLLRQQPQPTIGNKAEETETDQAASNQTDANAAGIQADQTKTANQSTQLPTGSLPIPDPRIPVASMPKALPKTAESKPLPPSHSSSTLPMPAPLSAGLAQFVHNAAADAAANPEPAKTANGDPAAGTVTEPGGTTVAPNGATAARTPAPLAFSMLIRPDTQSATNTAHPEAPAASAESAVSAPSSDMQRFSSTLAANGGAQTPVAPATPQRTPDEQTGALATGFTATERPHAAEDRPAAIQPASATNAADLDANAASVSRPELRNMRFQLEGDANQRVDVRLTDQSGALRVSVRSADVNLTQTLQDHMPELTSRLQQQHFRTEVWVPRTSATSDSGASNTRSFHSNGGNTSGQDQSGRRQNGRQQNQPHWFSDDAPNQAGKQETNQTWLQ